MKDVLRERGALEQEGRVSGLFRESETNGHQASRGRRPEGEGHAGRRHLCKHVTCSVKHKMMKRSARKSKFSFNSGKALPLELCLIIRDNCLRTLYLNVEASV